MPLIDLGFFYLDILMFPCNFIIFNMWPARLLQKEKSKINKEFNGQVWIGPALFCTYSIGHMETEIGMIKDQGLRPA
jgi:hypothetical protein